MNFHLFSVTITSNNSFIMRLLSQWLVEGFINITWSHKWLLLSCDDWHEYTLNVKITSLTVQFGGFLACFWALLHDNVLTGSPSVQNVYDFQPDYANCEYSVSPEKCGSSSISAVQENAESLFFFCCEAPEYFADDENLTWLSISTELSR